MKIFFKKIRWKNFLSYGNYWTEIDFEKYKTQLIIGKNGHGKCLEKNTRVEVCFKNKQTEKKFKKFMKRKK